MFRYFSPAIVLCMIALMPAAVFGQTPVCTADDIPSPPTGLKAFNYEPGMNIMQAYWTKSPDKTNGGENISIVHGYINTTSTLPNAVPWGTFDGSLTPDNVYPSVAHSVENPTQCTPSAAPQVLDQTYGDCHSVWKNTLQEFFRVPEARSFFAVAMQNTCGTSDFVIAEFKFSTPYAQTITAATATADKAVRLDWENEGNIIIGQSIDNTRDGMTIRWRNTSVGEMFLDPGNSPTAAGNRAIDIAAPAATTFYEIPAGTLTTAGEYELQVAPYNTFGRNAWSDAHGILVGGDETGLLALEVRAAGDGGKVFQLYDAAGSDATPLAFTAGTRANFAKLPDSVADFIFQLAIPVTSGVTAAGGETLTQISAGIHAFAATPALGITTYTFTVTSADTTATQNYSLTVNRMKLTPTSLAAEVTAVAEENNRVAAGDIINVMPAFESNKLTYALTLPYPAAAFRFVMPVNDLDLLDATAGIEVFGDNAAKLYSYPGFENSADITADTSTDYTETIAVGEHIRAITLTDTGGGVLTYEVGVTREAASADATLSAISLSHGALTPEFMPATLTYAARIPVLNGSVTVTPAVADTGGATVTVNTAAAVADNTASAPVAITAGGVAEISIVVTAENGGTQTYIINITATENAAADVNRDGMHDSADGFLIARYLLGMRGRALTGETIAGISTTAAAEIEARIAAEFAAKSLDVNRDDIVTAADGILISRYFLGVRGDALGDGQAAAGVAVETNIANFQELGAADSQP